MTEYTKSRCKFHGKALLLLSIMVALIYSNTLYSGWYLDDYDNIIGNPRVNITALDLASIKNSFYASPTKDSIDRPVAFFTFALNWFLHQDNVAGYRIVNIVIHILSAFFLFSTIFLLFQTPNLKGWNKNDIYFVALLSAVFWAINPIQIQAVTYIIQRMAALAALFYIIGIYFYLKARLSKIPFQRATFYCLCILAFLLGVGSKSNAIMLPVFLLIIEFVFFRDLSNKQTQKAAGLIFAGVGLLVFATGIILFLDGSLSGLFKGYETRPFNLYQRSLAQPGIVLFYLSQIFYPLASRFSIVHSVTIPTSLFSTWTTIPYVIIITLLILFSIWRIKKNPLLSFAILFFLGNHVVESSIVPLELVFEHRNYLPTLFLFVPVSVGIQKAFEYYRSTNFSMFVFLFFSISALVVFIGTSTYIRNMDWRSSKTLWENAIEKAPDSARSVHNLAWGHYEKNGDIEKALDLYYKALTLSYEKPVYKSDTYNNLASIYFNYLKDYSNALKYARKALEIEPLRYNTNMILCNSLGMTGRYSEALVQLDNLLLKKPDDERINYLKGFILLKLSKPEEALPYFEKCIRLSSSTYRYYREIGICFTEMNHYDRGYWFLKRAQSLSPNQTGTLISIADNRIRNGNLVQAELAIKRFIEIIGPDHIENTLIQLSEEPLGIPINYKNVTPLIAANLTKKAEIYTETATRLTNRFLDD